MTQPTRPQGPQKTMSSQSSNKRPLSPPPSSQPESAPQPPQLPKFLTHGPPVLRKKFKAINAHESTIRSNPLAILSHPLALARNRYPDINPWAHNRVQLHSLDFPYINASPIDLGREDERFIATQGPQETVEGARDFWEMCWQEEVEVVVMLTQPVEEGREKCGVYYPEDVGEAKELGEWGRVEAVDFRESFKTEVRKIRVVKKIKTGEGDEEEEKEEERTVWHFLFLGWPDQEVPKETGDFLELIRMSRFRIDNAIEEPKSKGKPRVVHCSAGVGRTGTFIALDHLLKELEDGELEALVGESGVTEDGEEIDPVFETVKKLREQRMFLVYQPGQYNFIYQILKERWEERKREGDPITPVKGPNLEDHEGSPTKKRKGLSDSFGGDLDSSPDGKGVE